MLRIKICGLTDPGNTGKIAELKPDYLGFIFYNGSPRFIGTAPGVNLFTIVTEGIKKTGVFVNETYDRIVQCAEKFNLDFIQLHGTESPELCRKLQNSGKGVIKAIPVSQYSDFNFCKPYTDCCDYFLFDTRTRRHGGSGEKFDWSILNGYEEEKQFFLSGGIGPGDTSTIINIKHEMLYGVDLNSGFEVYPGIKDYALLETFINEIHKTENEI